MLAYQRNDGTKARGRKTQREREREADTRRLAFFHPVTLYALPEGHIKHGVPNWLAKNTPRR